MGSLVVQPSRTVVPWIDPSVPDRSRLCALACGRVYVTDVGPLQASTVVLVHGIFGTQFVFRRLFAELSRTFRVVAPDLPGMGESDRVDLGRHDYDVTWLGARMQELLGHLQVHHAVMVGHDVGAHVMNAMPVDDLRVAHRVVVGAPLLQGALALPTHLRAALAVHEDAFALAMTRRDLRHYLLHSSSAPEVVDSVLVDVLWDRLARGGAARVCGRLLRRLPRATQGEGRAYNTSIPTSVILGDRDPWVSVDDARAWLAPQDVDVQVVEGAGHLCFDEVPRAFVEALTNVMCLSAGSQTPALGSV